MQISEREKQLIVTALYMLESDCFSGDLHHELEEDLGGVPNPIEVRTVMNKISCAETTEGG